MRKGFSFLVVCCLLAARPLAATDLQPWFPNDLEYQLSNTYWYQQYNSVAQGGGDRLKHHAHDQFDTLSLELSPKPEWSFELEGTFANTQRQHNLCDCLRETARYLLMDDILGDPVSMVAGLTLIQAFKRSVHDVSSFHHGHIEGELHLALGKEWSHEAYWNLRTWGLAALGMADVGYPWLRFNVGIERSWWGVHQVAGIINTLWGFGHKNILSVKHFDGYGPIEHQSVDLGIQYSYRFNIWGTLMLEYRRRVFARNFPNQTNCLSVNYVYPLGVGNGFLGF